jgi:hypothetical protein
MVAAGQKSKATHKKMLGTGTQYRSFVTVPVIMGPSVD